MNDANAFWEHELVWLDYLQKQSRDLNTNTAREVYREMIEKSLSFLKDEVFFGDLIWNEENGVFTCASSHDEAERLGYLNAILAQFNIHLKER